MRLLIISILFVLSTPTPFPLAEAVPLPAASLLKSRKDALYVPGGQSIKVVLPPDPPPTFVIRLDAEYQSELEGDRFYQHANGAAFKSCVSLIDPSLQQTCANARPPSPGNDVSYHCGGKYELRGTEKTSAYDPLTIRVKRYDSITFVLPIEVLGKLGIGGGSLNICFNGNGGGGSSSLEEQSGGVGSSKTIGILSIIPPFFLLPPPLKLTTAVRLFLTPGWELSVAIDGRNFTKQVNRLSLKLDKKCRGFYDQGTFISQRLQKIESGERRAGADEARGGESGVETALYEFDLNFRHDDSQISLWRSRYVDMQRPPYRLLRLPTPPSAEDEENKDEIDDWPSVLRGSGSQTLTPLVSDVIVRFYLCLYGSDQVANGTNAGQVIFHTDSKDSIQLVGFIIFAVVGIPFACGLTLSCYSYRHRKLRRQVRRLRLMQQRSQIEERLLQQLGYTKDDFSSDEGDEDVGGGAGVGRWDSDYQRLDVTLPTTSTTGNT